MQTLAAVLSRSFDEAERTAAVGNSAGRRVFLEEVIRHYGKVYAAVTTSTERAADRT